MTERDIKIGSLVDQGFITLPVSLRGWFKKQETTAEIDEKGHLCMDGLQFTSLSAMATHAITKVRGTPPPYVWSGYTYWHLTDPATQTLSTIKDVMHRCYLDVQEQNMAAISRPNVLMFRLKHGIITDAELQEFHEILDKMVWRNIWNTFCTVEPDDMNSYIWQRILNKCGTWDETRNLHVTTWIWRVACSELGKRRHIEKKRSLINGGQLNENTASEQLDTGSEDTTDERHRLMGEVEEIVAGMVGIEKSVAELLMVPVVGASGKLLNRMRSGEMCERLGISRKELSKHMRKIREKLAPVLEVNGE